MCVIPVITSCKEEEQLIQSSSKVNTSGDHLATNGKMKAETGLSSQIKSHWIALNNIY